MTTQSKRDKKLREDFTKKLFDMLAQNEDFLDIDFDKDNVLSFPTVDEEQNERCITITVSVPTGERNGCAYDCYEAHENYKLLKAEKQKKAEEKQKLKAQKIERDEKFRKEKKNKTKV